MDTAKKLSNGVFALRITFEAFSGLPETHLAEMRLAGREPVTMSSWVIVTDDEVGIDTISLRDTSMAGYDEQKRVALRIAEKVFEVTNRQDSKLFERMLESFPDNRTHTSLSCASLREMPGDLVEIAWADEDSNRIQTLALRCESVGFAMVGSSSAPATFDTETNTLFCDLMLGNFLSAEGYLSER